MGVKILYIDKDKVNKPKVEAPKRVSISDLITSCNDTADKMGMGNPNRQLVLNCAFALRQLVDRLGRFEADDKSVALGTEGDK